MGGKEKRWILNCPESGGCNSDLRSVFFNHYFCWHSKRSEADSDFFHEWFNNFVCVCVCALRFRFTFFYHDYAVSFLHVGAASYLGINDIHSTVS